MKKLIIPAIVIAAIGGYFYYQNMESATSEEAIVQEVDAAVEEAGAAVEEPVEKDMMAAKEVAEGEGDVFADPEQMMETAEDAADEAMDAAEEAAETVADKAEEMTEQAMDEMPQGEIDHAEE